eukprot:TRINITY_DN4574_c0_g4_i1.p5 TRINITY_DN4574_c0_g4~~TRINITY_DN4574_c0_g4_i1.p5  ORF type:complete len:390 (-),score=61.06 TRINITY_DN4574_c0_g4_i1:20894-22063(-)
MNMKRTILATVIAATSFGAMANVADNAKFLNSFNENVDGYNIVLDANGEVQIHDENGSLGSVGSYDKDTGQFTQTDAQKANSDAAKVGFKIHGKSVFDINAVEARMAERKSNLKEIIVDNDAERIKQKVRDISRDNNHERIKQEVRNIASENDYERIKQEVRNIASENDYERIKQEVRDIARDNNFERIKQEAREKAAENDYERIVAYIKDNNGDIAPVLPIDGQPSNPQPIEGEKPEPTPEQNLVAGLKQAKEMLEDAGYNLGETGQNLTESGKAAAQQTAVQQNQIDELYALGNQNASDIDTLFAEVDRLDTRIDQTQALNAATVNARPMVANGMTAFGAGVGYAGSEAALAVGVAHSFVDTGWSASGTLAASSDDVVVGGGVQYAF